ncbi:MAG: lysylphosphatidylglycerol synthase domain-containing protein [Candidatus Micrarchaeota archaeon]
MNWKNAVYVAALAAVAYALLKLFDAEKALPSLNPLLAAAAVALYLLSIVPWNAAWGKHLGSGFWEANKIGWAAQFGSLTPFSIGNDVLRGYFGKRYGKPATDSIAASLATKFHKIAIALAFSVAGVFALVARHSELGETVALGVVLPIALLGGVYFLTREAPMRWVAKLAGGRLGGGKAENFARRLREYLHKPRIDALGLLGLSLLLELTSFYCCFAAFGVILEPFSAYLIFTLLFFVAKIPLVPQGIGVTEAIGLVILRDSAALPFIAAGLLLWSVARIWAPVVASFAFYSALRAAEKK